MRPRKNWSLIYRAPGGKPEFAPVFEVLSTIPCITADAMALLAGEQPSAALNVQQLKAFANRARLQEAAMLKAVGDTVGVRQRNLVVSSRAQSHPDEVLRTCGLWHPFRLRLSDRR